MSKFQELRHAVEQHVEAEEQQLFVQVLGVLTPEEAQELGVAVEVAKKDIEHDASPQCGGTPEL